MPSQKLRQQLVTLAGRRHPDLRLADRVFWILPDFGEPGPSYDGADPAYAD